MHIVHANLGCGLIFWGGDTVSGNRTIVFEGTIVNVGMKLYNNYQIKL